MSPLWAVYDETSLFNTGMGNRYTDKQQTLIETIMMALDTVKYYTGKYELDMPHLTAKMSVYFLKTTILVTGKRNACESYKSLNDRLQLAQSNNERVNYLYIVSKRLLACRVY